MCVLEDIEVERRDFLSQQFKDDLTLPEKRYTSTDERQQMAAASRKA
jgi:hypothetical protein